MAVGKTYNLGNAMAKWGQTIVDHLRKEVKRDDTNASGRLIASIRPQIKIFGSKFTMEIHMEDYWKSVDSGTRPGTKPDVNKILRWMQNKKIFPKPTKGGLTKPRSAKNRKVFKDRRLALAERIANAIYRKGTIKRFGYKGSGFVSEYTSTLAERMRESIREATGKDIKIQVINALK
jgi:hypothetical protein